jgi:hypothetical protein
MGPERSRRAPRRAPWHAMRGAFRGTDPNERRCRFSRLEQAAALRATGAHCPTGVRRRDAHTERPPGCNFTGAW